MQTLVFYPAFVATFVSIVSLSHIAYRTYDGQRPLALSELAATEEHLLAQFRTVLWICGTLFAVTMYWFVVPRIRFAILVAIAWSLEYIGDLVLAAVPARDKTWLWHAIFAQIMALGMLSLTYLFWLSLGGAYMWVELSIAVAMSVLGALAFIDRRRFIFYELPFIFLSHIAILVAVLTLR